MLDVRCTISYNHTCLINYQLSIIHYQFFVPGICSFFTILASHSCTEEILLSYGCDSRFAKIPQSAPTPKYND